MAKSVMESRAFYSATATAAASSMDRRGELARPGAASPLGSVQTDDLSVMCANTTNFKVQRNRTQLAIGFWDNDGNWMGAYYGAEISSVAGTFTGSGCWSC
jgi:hypothetical protein